MKKAKIPTAKDWKKLRAAYPTRKKLAEVITRKPFKREIEARKKAGVKGAEIYARVGVTGRYINMLVKGERTARQDVAQVFKVVKTRYRNYVTAVAESYDLTMKEAQDKVKGMWKKKRQWVKYA